MFYLFSEVLVFLSQKLNLVFTLKKAPLEVVLFARNHRYLVLHISKVEDLLLKPLLASYQLLRLGIKILLHFVKGSIKASNGAFKVLDLLILREQLPLVVGDIILENRVV